MAAAFGARRLVAALHTLRDPKRLNRFNFNLHHLSARPGRPIHLIVAGFAAGYRLVAPELPVLQVLPGLGDIAPDIGADIVGDIGAGIAAAVDLYASRTKRRRANRRA